MALNVPAVLQPQGAKFFVGQLTRQVPLQLVAVLLGARMNEMSIEWGVGVHRGSSVISSVGKTWDKRAMRRREPTLRSIPGLPNDREVACIFQQGMMHVE
jgi:hypothetical protein